MILEYHLLKSFSSICIARAVLIATSDAAKENSVATTIVTLDFILQSPENH